MKATKKVLEGTKVPAIFSAVALIVWSMPEYDGPPGPLTESAQLVLNRR